MGLSASQARFLSLTARQNDLEFQGQQVNQQRTGLADNTQQVSTQIANLLASDPAAADTSNATGTVDPNTAQYITLNNQLTSIQAQDKILELDLKNIDTQHQ